MHYQGSCHCGAIKFTVDTELDSTARCNCSICGRAGTLMHFAAKDGFKLTEGEAHYKSYTFGRQSIVHGFCDVCGVRPFGRSADGSQDKMMINVGCLEGVDVRDFKEVPVFDGKAL